jgi:hypothetical protein
MFEQVYNRSLLDTAGIPTHHSAFEKHVDGRQKEEEKHIVVTGTTLLLSF